jgi:hypothetical protein
MKGPTGVSGETHPAPVSVNVVTYGAQAVGRRSAPPTLRGQSCRRVGREPRRSNDHPLALATPAAERNGTYRSVPLTARSRRFVRSAPLGAVAR